MPYIEAKQREWRLEEMRRKRLEERRARTRDANRLRSASATQTSDQQGGEASDRATVWFAWQTLARSFCSTVAMSAYAWTAWNNCRINRVPFVVRPIGPLRPATSLESRLCASFYGSFLRLKLVVFGDRISHSISQLGVNFWYFS